MKHIVLVITLLGVFGIAKGQHGAEHPKQDAHPQTEQPAKPEPTAPGTHEVPAEEHSPAAPHEGGAEHAKSDKYDPTADIMHHIANSNEFHVFGDVTIPLPCIFYAKDKGVTFTMSSAFHHGSKAVDGYVLAHGQARRIKDFAHEGEAELEVVHPADGENPAHYVGEEKNAAGEETSYIVYEGKKYELEAASSLMGFTSWFDFSITKNVFTMLLAGLLLCGIFITIAKAYKKNAGKAPSGIQSFFEPVIVFMRDEVAKPNIPHQWEKFLPLILTIFFFILFNNLLGLVPFFPGGSNVTGNIATTLALALIAFVVTNINGKADYWKHIFWMPGLPPAIKLFLAPIEFLGVFTKPISLMIRLFANITAGHIIILSLVSLIYVFGNKGESIPGSIAGMGLAIPFVLFMNVIELIVAFIQAFIFAMLTASYIGAAVEEHHHEEHAH